jgi:ribonuclease BN (tRNA processing enzyme)
MEGRVARRIKAEGAKRAVLIYIRPRYSDEDLLLLESQAKTTFAEVLIGRDLDSYSVPYADE